MDESKQQSERKNTKLNSEIILEEAIKKSLSLLTLDNNIASLSTSRQKHFDFIRNEISDAITDRQGIAIYACGLPGTGKSLVFHKVIETISQQFPNADCVLRGVAQQRCECSQFIPC